MNSNSAELNLGTSTCIQKVTWSDHMHLLSVTHFLVSVLYIFIHSLYFMTFPACDIESASIFFIICIFNLIQ